MSTKWPSGVGRRVLDCIDSTNAEAARIAPGLTGPEWILALRQSAGRGRRGRDWVDPVGNFAATYVMKPSEPAEFVALRSFVAALAVYDAIATVSGRTEGLSLKWPNDVLLNGAKVAGILLESSGTAQQISHLAIGIGVNLLHAPASDQLPENASPAVSLAEQTGANVTPEDFLDALAPAYAKWERVLTQDGFEAIRQAWLARAARLGQVITARAGRAEHRGTFETVDESGNLVLSTAQGRQKIPAADVYF